MKNILTSVTIAALVAFVLFQFSFEISLSFLFVAGLAAIAIRDYARTMRLNRVRALVPAAALRRSERFGLAA